MSAERHLADLRAGDGPAFPVVTEPAIDGINAQEVPKPRTMREIADAVAPLYGLDAKSMVAAKQKHKLSPARHHAMWEMHERGFSNMQIARFFGLMDHTTVISGRKRHEARLAEGRAA